MGLKVGRAPDVRGPDTGAKSRCRKCLAFPRSLPPVQCEAQKDSECHIGTLGPVTEGTVYISVRSEGTRFAHRLRSESHNFERRSTDAPPPGKCMKKVVK